MSVVCSCKYCGPAEYRPPRDLRADVSFKEWSNPEPRELLDPGELIPWDEGEEDWEWWLNGGTDCSSWDLQWSPEF